MSVPLLFMHVRCSVPEDVGIEALVPLRDELRALAAKYGEVFAVRIKRRCITQAQADQLLGAYTKRVAVTETYIKTGRTKET